MGLLMGMLRDRGWVEKGFTYVESTDVRTAGFSLVAPPVPLWQLRSGQRGMIMNGDLVAVCFYSQNLWEGAFERAGGALVVDETGAWEVKDRDGEALRFPWTEVMHAKVGAAFLGFSPTQVAQAIVKPQRGGDPETGPRGDKLARNS